MNRLALFNQDELALAFSLVLPDDAARALAQEWFAHFAAVEDVNDEGYFLAPEDAEDVAMDEEPAILASSESAASSSEVEYINLQGMPIEEKRRWLLSFSDLHLGLLALSSPQLSDRVRRYLRDSDEAAARRHRHMERIVRALNS